MYCWSALVHIYLEFARSMGLNESIKLKEYHLEWNNYGWSQSLWRKLSPSKYYGWYFWLVSYLVCQSVFFQYYKHQTNLWDWYWLDESPLILTHDWSKFQPMNDQNLMGKFWIHTGMFILPREELTSILKVHCHPNVNFSHKIPNVSLAWKLGRTLVDKPLLTLLTLRPFV